MLTFYVLDRQCNGAKLCIRCGKLGRSCMYDNNTKSRPSSKPGDAKRISSSPVASPEDTIQTPHHQGTRDTEVPTPGHAPGNQQQNQDEICILESPSSPTKVSAPLIAYSNFELSGDLPPTDAVWPSQCLHCCGGCCYLDEGSLCWTIAGFDVTWISGEPIGSNWLPTDCAYVQCPGRLEDKSPF